MADDGRKESDARSFVRKLRPTKLLLVAFGVVVFIMMLTWDRGHFPQERPKIIDQPASK